MAIVPGLTLNSNVNTLLAAYAMGRSRTRISLSGRPHVDLGTFSKPFLITPSSSPAVGTSSKAPAP